MLYLVPVLTLSMLGYMAYAIVFRLRRDRIKTERELTRGKAVFRPMHRMQYLLRRSFEPPRDRPDWEQELINSAANVLPASNSQEPESARATAAR
jgi:hypothetical protein